MNISEKLRVMAEYEDLTGTSFDIVNEASATIAALEKRLEELEALYEALKQDAEIAWQTVILKGYERDDARQALTAERQRREELERELGKWQKAT